MIGNANVFQIDAIIHRLEAAIVQGTASIDYHAGGQHSKDKRGLLIRVGSWESLFVEAKSLSDLWGKMHEHQSIADKIQTMLDNYGRYGNCTVCGYKDAVRYPYEVMSKNVDDGSFEIIPVLKCWTCAVKACDAAEKAHVAKYKPVHNL